MAPKAKRDPVLDDLFARANAVGHRAATAAAPTPMVVERHANPLDDASPVLQRWHVPEGPCGFAWVTLRPGTSRAARYARAHHGARPGYRGGVQVWVGGYGQSVERKDAYAAAFAEVLRAADVRAYSESRLD